MDGEGDRPSVDDQDDDKTLYQEDPNNNDNDNDNYKITPSLPSMANYVMGSNRLDDLEGSTLNDGDDGGERHRIHLNNGVDMDQVHVKQLKYNKNKILLDRSINNTIELFKEFKENNINSPIHYPIEQMIDNGYDSKLNNITSKNALRLKRRSSADNNNVSNIENLFDILKLDVNIGLKNNNDEFINNLDDSTISMILNAKFEQILNHLYNLKERVEDISSKVLITGDLNSGKSSFCNKLLRRNLLPVDQQPCTNVFCEIINYKENNLIEEVHAIPIGCEYNKRNQTTYNIFNINQLEDLVYENDKYSLLKIYVNDNRPTSESLLKNGIIDIRLIDAPGLNLDSYQTMQLFSRKEEIDLVIFVVNAENHFTLSGREFISNVHNDKKLTFIVVNKFDSIKRKDKCIEKIMQQVGDLSPETHKDSDDFVHFVTSNGIDNNKPNGSDDPGNDPNNDNNNNNNNDPNFDRLEASLRNFIVDKRSVSKLLPAQKYLKKIFQEIIVLIDMNIKEYNSNKEEINKELNEIKPKYDEIIKQSIKINDKVMNIIDEYSDDVYENTRKNINDKIDKFSKIDKIDKNVTIFNIDQFIQNTKLKVVHDILSSIEDSEDYGRLKTLHGITNIRQLGKNLLGEDNLIEHKFKPESMYSHKKDKELKNQININFEIIDLIDFDSIFNFFQSIQNIFNLGSFSNLKKISKLNNEELSISSIISSNIFKTGISSAFILYIPKVISIFTGVKSIIKLPKIVTFTAVGFMIGYPIYYFIKESPKNVHKNIIKKIKSNLERDDYIHLNSLRISKEVRKVLNYPAKDVSVGINGLIERESNLKMKLINKVNLVKSNLKFLQNIKERVEIQQEIVNKFQLDID